MATFYNKTWEKASPHPDLANWIMPGSSKNNARCRFCGGNDISLGNMGVNTWCQINFWLQNTEIQRFEQICNVFLKQILDSRIMEFLFLDH